MSNNFGMKFNYFNFEKEEKNLVKTVLQKEVLLLSFSFFFFPEVFKITVSFSAGCGGNQEPLSPMGNQKQVSLWTDPGLISHRMDLNPMYKSMSDVNKSGYNFCLWPWVILPTRL